MNKPLGLFVTFEGGEGSGKTTLVSGLKERLLKSGYKTVITREPGGCPASEEIRNIIMKYPNLDNLTEAALYAAARKQHCVETIEPAIKDHAIILCDRYIYSNMVYQGYVNNGLDGMQQIYELNKKLDVVFPDLTFFLDVSPEVGLQRIQKNGREINRFDLKGIEYHQKVYEGYKLSPKQYTFSYRWLDASNPHYEELIDEAYKAIIKAYNFE